MKIRIYKQIVEVGHYSPNWESYGDDWIVDQIIEDAEEVEKYLIEARKETTSFARGVFLSNNLTPSPITHILLYSSGFIPHI